MLVERLLSKGIVLKLFRCLPSGFGVRLFSVGISLILNSDPSTGKCVESSGVAQLLPVTNNWRYCSEILTPLTTLEASKNVTT